MFKSIRVGSVLVILMVCCGTVSAQRTAPPPGRSQGDMGKMLLAGLKEVDGCLAVKQCGWNDGKQSIVAWFKNKKAAEEWYYSPIHQAMMAGGNDGELPQDKKPMQYFQNEDQPLMVMATITPSDKPGIPGVPIPISQISIELFAAIPGGAEIGGRVSPKHLTSRTFVTTALQRLKRRVTDLSDHVRTESITQPTVVGGHAGVGRADVLVRRHAAVLMC